MGFGGSGCSKISTGRGVGGRRATVSLLCGPLPGMDPAAPLLLPVALGSLLGGGGVRDWALARNVDMIWWTGAGTPRLSLDATDSLRDAWVMAQLQCSFGEPRLVEPDGGSGMPGGLRGYVPDSTVGRGWWKEESALHLN